MDTSLRVPVEFRSAKSAPPRLVVLFLLLGVAGATTGCAAMTNPVADGVPARLLPRELMAPSKADLETIPLNTLRQPAPDEYRLGPGDVLGVYIDGITGSTNQPVPSQPASPVRIPDQLRVPPGAGFPFPVHEDGTISMPEVSKISVQGLTLEEARTAIRNAYIKEKRLTADQERGLMVTILFERHYEVLVFRQEALNFQIAIDGPVPISKRNVGHLVDLPAYQNDVLHALALTGGLPGLDDYNEIIVFRDRFRDQQHRMEVLQQLQAVRPGGDVCHLLGWGGETIRIPLRLPCGAPMPFKPGDIVLQKGDVVFLEARDEQVFYTGGLLPPGRFVLPRDHDLDAVEAISMVHGSLYNGAFGGSNLSGLLINPGLGNPSPSLLTVLRRVPHGPQVTIIVDLREALRHPQERLILAPGDIVLLQEKPCEAFARVFTQTIFNFDLFWTPWKSSAGSAVIDVAAPDRLTGSRVGTIYTPTP